MYVFISFENVFCYLAAPHVKGLEIRLTQMLSDWEAGKGVIATVMMEGKEFPSFSDFAVFLSLEAGVARMMALLVKHCIYHIWHRSQA